MRGIRHTRMPRFFCAPRALQTCCYSVDMDTTSTISTERLSFAQTGRYAVRGSRDMASTGIAALTALPEYLEHLTAIDVADGAVGTSEVAEIQLWENMPVTALVISDLGFTTHHVWAGDRWVEYVY